MKSVTAISTRTFHPLTAWAALIILAAVWLLGIFGAPRLMAGGHQLVASALYEGFSSVCHQRPDRSFHYLGLPLGVCARCTGIYAGFLAGLTAAPVIFGPGNAAPPARKWLIAAALPMAVDYAGDLFGLFTNSHLSRALTGGILGLTGAWYILPALTEILSSGMRAERRYRHFPEGEAE